MNKTQEYELTVVVPVYNEVDCRVLAHRQAHSCEDAYGERRDNE